MAKRPSGPTVIPLKRWTLEELDKGIKKLEKRREQIRALENLSYDDQEVENATADFVDSVREIYGDPSSELERYRYHRIWKGGYNLLDEPEECQFKFHAGIPDSIKLIDGLIERLNERKAEVSDVGNPPTETVRSAPASNDAFIVHGHNEGLKQTVARFVSQLGLNPIILHEKPNEGKTLIEKFEKHSNVPFAIILLTADDVGASKSQPNSLKPRARQNVVGELFYFLAKLGRNKVCALYEEEVELPSDLHGIAYTKLDPNAAWKFELAREMKAAGLTVDLNKVV